MEGAGAGLGLGLKGATVGWKEPCGSTMGWFGVEEALKAHHRMVGLDEVLEGGRPWDGGVGRSPEGQP